MAAIAAVVAGGLGIASLFQKKDKPPAPTPLPVAPSVANAQTDAAAQLAKQRRISALNGGNTGVTQANAQGGAGAYVGTKSLLGQ